MTPTVTPLLPKPVSHPARNLDHWTHAKLAPLTGGISTVALQLAFMDWLLHLSRNPGQMAELRVAAGQEAALLAGELVALHAASSADAPQPPGNLLQDRRFADPAWQTWPFNLYSQAFLRTQAWWQRASTGVRGVSKHHEDVVSFTLRQLLDTLSPANQVATNPVVLQRMVHTGGASLWQGFQNYQDDMQLLRAQAAPLGTDAYPVGTVVATSPGQVVFRNRLIELIQYTPSGDSVHPEPILIVPAWIMKYYILDLSPGNSLVKYLVDQGFTVFVVSWTNPTAHDRDLGLDDYLRMGVMDALDAVCTVVPGPKVHAVGYCLGGTLLSMAAAAMGRDGRLASLTLLAAQTDFSEPGELALFINESQIALLEDSMWDKGYLDNQQMAGAFQMISSTDLVWSRMLHDYLMGQRTPVGDVMAWNADGTRLPYRMHTEYLRSLYLHNDLARGRYPVQGKPVALTDIGCPIFCVGTVRDHVAPWRSVYKLHLLTDVELTFLLTSGGHNVGIVNPPGVPHRSYQVEIRQHGGKFVDPDTWLAATPEQEGSWWPVWADWLQARSGPLGALPSMGAEAQGLPPLCPAPGTYVLQK